MSVFRWTCPGVYLDTLYKLIDNDRGKSVDIVVLLHQGDKLRHIHGLSLLLIKFSVEGLVLFSQRVLFILIGLRQVQKTLVRQFPGYIVLREFLLRARLKMRATYHNLDIWYLSMQIKSLNTRNTVKDGEPSYLNLCFLTVNTGKQIQYCKVGFGMMHTIGKFSTKTPPLKIERWELKW